MSQWLWVDCLIWFGGCFIWYSLLFISCTVFESNFFFLAAQNFSIKWVELLSVFVDFIWCSLDKNCAKRFSTCSAFFHLKHGTCSTWANSYQRFCWYFLTRFKCNWCGMLYDFDRMVDLPFLKYGMPCILLTHLFQFAVFMRVINFLLRGILRSTSLNSTSSYLNTWRKIMTWYHQTKVVDKFNLKYSLRNELNIYIFCQRSPHLFINCQMPFEVQNKWKCKWIAFGVQD